MPDGRAPGPGIEASGPSAPPTAQEDLLLRLRVEELERELEGARGRMATQAALLDATYRSRAWKALVPLRRALQAGRPDVLAAQAAATEDAATRLPLAGLPCAAADGGPGRWTDEIVVDGVALPGLLADPPETVAWRLVPEPGGRLEAFAALRAAGWLGNRGGVVFAIVVRDEAGAEVRRAELHVDPAGRPAHRTWLPIAISLDGLPACEHRVELETRLPPDAAPVYAWAAWGDPVLRTGPAPPPPAGPAVLGAVREAGRLARARLRPSPVAPAPPPQTGPVISLLVPVHDPALELLDAMLASVAAQRSPRWQLCLCDDGSRDPAVRRRLAEAAAGDPRIVAARHDEAQGISAATNRALTLATGEFVAPLDHDDVLHPDAIGDVAAALAAEPTADMAYTDNDKAVPDGRRLAASLKPDWSPELLRAVMYTLHLGAYRRELVEELGGWRPEFDGAQDHDLVLRLSERARRIVHVPEVRYHWRVHPGSAALTEEAKPEAYERGCRAVDEHLRRTGVAGRAERLPQAGRYRVVHDAADDAVDVVLPVVPAPATSAELVRRCTEALAAGHDGRPVTVTAAGPAALVDGVPGAVAAGDAWAACLTAAAAAGRGGIVIVVDELCAPDGPAWLDELAGLAGEPPIAAAGGLVVDREGRALHAGVALPRGAPLPVHPGAPTEGEACPVELTMVSNRAAVSGVVALRRERLAGEAVGSLVALTLGLGARAGRIVHSPHARLRLLDGAVARATLAVPSELRAIAAARAGRPDPYYHRGLWADRATHVVPAARQRAGLLGEDDAAA